MNVLLVEIKEVLFNRGDPYPTPKMPQRLLVKLLRDFNFNKTSLDCIIFHLHYFKKKNNYDSCQKISKA